jgi:hypothetical protein
VVDANEDLPRHFRTTGPEGISPPTLAQRYSFQPQGHSPRRRCVQPYHQG